MMLMAYRNLQKTVKFCIKICEISSRIYCKTYHRYSVLSFSRLKYFPEVNSRYFSSSNFCRNIELLSSDSKRDNRPIESQQLVKVIFTRPNGEEIALLGKVGKSVMEVAVKANEDIMAGSCDGKLACTTCHVYVEEETKKYFHEPSIEEEDLLDRATSLNSHSRLSCQLKLSAEMSEIRFGLPLGTYNSSGDNTDEK